MKIKTKLGAAATAVGLSFIPLQSAHAAGWIAKNIIKPIAGKKAAKRADLLHERLDKPLDKLRDEILGPKPK